MGIRVPLIPSGTFGRGDNGGSDAVQSTALAAPIQFAKSSWCELHWAEELIVIVPPLLEIRPPKAQPSSPPPVTSILDREA
jgi:hypothetical protein